MAALSLSARAAALAERTSDAYSFDRYSSWSGVARALLSLGYSEREAEAIMRSKHLRWAADGANLERNVSVSAVKEYLAKYPISAKALASLVAETFA